MVSKLLILVVRAWQLGPSRVLPPSCRYTPSCSAYAITALSRYGALRGGWLAARRAPLPPWGVRPRSRSMTSMRPVEHRAQEHDPGDRPVGARHPRLGLHRRDLVPAANPPTTQVEKGRPVAVPQPQADPAADTPAAIRDRRIVLAETPRVRIEDAAAHGSLNLAGARVDDLVLTTHPRAWPATRRRCGCSRRPAPAIPISAASAGPARASAPRRRHGLGPAATADAVEPGHPALDNGQGQVFQILLSIDDGYLIEARQTVGNRGAGAVAVRPSPMSAGSAPRATWTAGPPMSARWACSTARPITTTTMTTSPRKARTASPAAAAGSASPTNTGWRRSFRQSAASTRRFEHVADQRLPVLVPGRPDHRPAGRRRDLHVAPVRRRQGDPLPRRL